VKGRISSLLRPPAALVAGVALAGVVAVSGTSAFAAGSTARTPDPAPLPPLVQPDPYSPASWAPSASRSTTTSAAVGASESDPTGLTHAAATRHDRASRAAVRSAEQTEARKATRSRNARSDWPGELAADVFAIPGHPAPRLAALAAVPAADLRRVPVGAALAVALVVLLSGALLTRVSRAAIR
jgi:hypothetical protein